jgi:hypothetical protein
MQDYLNQLVHRIQQPALVVQPRPVSRFESPRNPAVDTFDPASSSKSFGQAGESSKFFKPHEPVTARESGELEAFSSLSDRLATEMGADGSVQQIESSSLHHEAEMADALFRDLPAAASLITDHANRTTSTRQPGYETDPIATSGGQPIELSRQTAPTAQAEQTVPTNRAAAEPTQSVMRKENAAENEIASLNNLPLEQWGHHEQTEYVNRGGREQIKPDTVAKQPAITASLVSANLSIYPLERQGKQQILPEPTESIAQGKRAQHQPGTMLNKPVAMPSVVSADSLSAYPQPIVRDQSYAQTAKEPVQPLISPVNAENPGSKLSSPDSTPIAISRREELVSTLPARIEPLPKWGSDSIFPPVPGKAIFRQPFAEPAALQHTTEQLVEAPAPTIQVTIGRIEVRATVAAPAPARKAPAKSSTMSLDEYLKQRDGRQR